MGRASLHLLGLLHQFLKVGLSIPGGMFIFHVFAALAEFIRTIIVANTNDGPAAARARGQRLGRPPVMTPEKIAYALALLAEPDRSLRSIAALLKVSPTTHYKALPELLTPQQARPAGQADRGAAARPASRRRTS